MLDPRKTQVKISRFWDFSIKIVRDHDNEKSGITGPRPDGCICGGDAASLGLGLNVPLGPFLATVGGKGIYTNPNDGDEGYAAAVGGGLQWKIGDSFGLFGEYYYSPDSLSSGIDSYEEANAGARWTIMRPITIEAGYRYLNLAGKDGNRDNALADGPYVGVSAGF